MAKGKKRRAAGEGHIRLRPDGSWEARLSVPNHKPRSFYGKTQAEAMRKRDEARMRLSGLAFDADTLTFGEYLGRWLKDSVRGSVRETTFDNYETLVRRHLVPALGSLKLSKLRAAHLQGLYRAKLEEGLTPGRVRLIHAVASRALNQAVKWQLLPSNPAKATDPPRPKDKEIHPLSREVVGRVLEEVSRDRLGALFVLAVFTGLRAGELLGLKWEDLNLEEGEARIERQAVKPKSGLRFGPLKRDAGRRTIELPAVVVQALRHHRKQQLAEKLKAPSSAWRDLGLVFCRDDGSMLDPQEQTRRFLRPLLERCGIDAKDATFHGLRHTFATLMFLNDEHPKVVQQALGHARISETLDRYSHYIPAKQKQAAARLGEMFDNQDHQSG